MPSNLHPIFQQAIAAFAPAETLSQALASFGLSHRKSSRFDGKQTISDADGDLGCFDSAEAWEYVEALHAARDTAAGAF